MAVRFPAGPQVSLKCGDQSKDNGAGHKKKGADNVGETDVGGDDDDDGDGDNDDDGVDVDVDLEKMV